MLQPEVDQTIRDFVNSLYNQPASDAEKAIKFLGEALFSTKKGGATLACILSELKNASDDDFITTLQTIGEVINKDQGVPIEEVKLLDKSEQ